MSKVTDRSNKIRAENKHQFSDKSKWLENNFLNVEKQVWPDTVMNYECAPPTRD